MFIENKKRELLGKHFVITTICLLIIVSLFYLVIMGIRPGAAEVDDTGIEQIDLGEQAITLNNQLAIWYPGALYESKDFLLSPDININSEEKYGTYRILVNIPADKSYGITGLTADYAQKVYVNGELLYEIGQISDDKVQFVPKTDYYSLYFTPPTNTTEIIIQVAYHNHEYGFLKDIYLAEQQVIVERNRAEFLSNGIILGILLAFVLFFLGMFLSYNTRISFLWFALTCLCAALRYAIYFSKDIMVLLPDLSWYALHKIEYVSHLGFYFFLSLHALSVLNLKLDKWLKYAFFGGLGMICIYYILMPSTIYTQYIFIIGTIISVLLLVVACYILYKSYRQKLFNNNENLIVGLSTVIMVAIWFIEAFTYQGFSWYVQPYITMLIVFFNAIALTLQFSRTERELAYLQNREQEIAKNAATLERINTMKTDFFHKMAHEIKTPLAIMSGYAQLTGSQITNGEVNAETTLNLKVISAEAKRLSELVSNLMEMPSTPISEAILNEMSVAEYLRYVSVICKGLLEKKGNHFVIKGNINQIILGNIEMLVQMMINLATNSNKHMSNGTFTIEVSEKNEHVVLIVSDTGCGIPQGDADKIFEKGFTTSGTKGLGLAICKEIVQLHKGEIELLDERKGAVFKIIIPIYENKEVIS